MWAPINPLAPVTATIFNDDDDDDDDDVVVVVVIFVVPGPAENLGRLS